MSLDQLNLSKEDEEQLKRAIVDVILNHPPTIGVVGVSGTGKSSTINALFKTDLEISHVVACTKEFRKVDLRVQPTGDWNAGNKTVLRVVDAPGLGEDIQKDTAYLASYRANLTKCDVILWILAARNRAMALDQMYIKELADFSDKMVFGVNQVDLVEPMDWNSRINLPSEEQETNIDIIKQDRAAKIRAVLGRDLHIIPYSAKKKYNLQELFTTIIEALPKERAWIFSAIKGFRPDDFLPEGIRDQVMQMVEKSKPKKSWFRH